MEWIDETDYLSLKEMERIDEFKGQPSNRVGGRQSKVKGLSRLVNEIDETKLNVVD